MFCSFKREGFICRFAMLAVLASSAFGQIVIDNPDRPRSKKAGRTVLLEEAVRIHDDGEKVIFRAPMRLSLAPDGSLLFFEGASLYKFGQDGRFSAQLLKAGEGPGECKYPDQYLIAGNKIRVEAWVPPKIMDFDLDGRYLREAKMKIAGPFWFLSRIDGKIYGIRDEIRHSDAIFKEGYFETPYTIYEIADDFQKMNRLYDIPVQHYIKQRRWWRLGMLTFAAHNHYLFIVHTAEYKIIKLDLRTAAIERIFKRKYERKRGGPGEAR
jgi:hypothetical protein